MDKKETPLVKKLKSILDIRLENDLDLVESLKAISEFFDENSIRSRRNLRSNLEKRNTVICEEFLGAYEKVNTELNDLCTIVGGMHQSCCDMSSRLQAVKVQTQDLLKQTTQMQEESETYEIKARVAEAFLAKFQLTPAEEKQLTAKDGKITDEFFRALLKARQIHSDCKILLLSRNQTSGLEIMEQMSLFMECGCEKLYRWAQNECRMQTHESVDTSSLLCQVFQILQERPVLLKYTLDEYATARRSAMVRGFIEALTRGGPSGTPRPMELHSHDPLRYCGDMLAWLHQTAASEQEHLDTLLRLCDDEPVRDLRVACLDSLTEAPSRPLRTRVEQVLAGQQDAVTLYRLSSLLRFHATTLEKLCPGALSKTVQDLASLASRLFFGSLSNYTQRALGEASSGRVHLGEPPAAVGQTLSLLQQLLSAQDAAMLPLASRKEDLHQVLEACVEPLVQLCTVQAAFLPPLEMALYLVNCLHSLQAGLAAYEFTAEKIAKLQSTLEPHLDTLISAQLHHILENTLLLPLYQAMTQPHNGPLSENPSLSTPAVRASMVQLDSFLARPDRLYLGQLDALQSSKLRSSVHRRAFDQLHSVYTTIYDSLTNQQNLFPAEVKSALVRDPDQVAKLILS